MKKQYRNTQYYISNDGIVTNSRGKELKQNYNKLFKYKSVLLRIDGKTKGLYVHRLVAELYIDNPLNKQFVNHINGNKHDNRVENLEWVTRSENQKHAYKLGLIKEVPTYKGKFGKNHNRSIEVRKYDKEWNLLNTFNGLSEAYRKTNILPSSISYACENETLLKGFYWQKDTTTIRQKNL